MDRYKSYTPADVAAAEEAVERQLGQRNGLDGPTETTLTYPPGRNGNDASVIAYGYFGGPGWTMGIVEAPGNYVENGVASGSSFRVSTDSLLDYRNGTSNTIVFVNPDGSPSTRGSQTYQGNDPNAPNYLPSYNNLSALDKLFFAHDLAYEEAFDDFSANLREYGDTIPIHA